LLTQLGIIHAGRHGQTGLGCCVLDLDLQFGDAAFQLGLQPPLSVMNLLSAGNRIDHVVVQAAAASHPSGLKLIAAPTDLLPLDSVSCDQLLDVVDVALETFDTILVDLPANWTDWSMSLVARSTLVLLVTEMTIPALRQARRQLDLLEAQDLGRLDIRIVLNRHQEQLFRAIKVADATDALGRPVNYTVGNDPALIRTAIDQGLALDDIKRRSGPARDLARISDDIARLVLEDG
jgi:pilus assembly protein CpaE